MSTKNESEVGLAQGTTGVNDTREHVQELERECANMKYEILEVKTKRAVKVNFLSVIFDDEEGKYPTSNTPRPNIEKRLVTGSGNEAGGILERSNPSR
ncbi:hypothetical protein Tco_0366197 [Tanacetum coccineum]